VVSSAAKTTAAFNKITNAEKERLLFFYAFHFHKYLSFSSKSLSNDKINQKLNIVSRTACIPTIIPFSSRGSKFLACMA
jgi:hypothetical protein